jgi:cupin fold WbuC family metalloprotein
LYIFDNGNHKCFSLRKYFRQQEVDKLKKAAKIAMNHDTDYPRALRPPPNNVVIINNNLIQKAIDSSRISPRKRIILPFHKLPSDNLHRMLNALQPNSYVQPHRHLDPPKAESIIVLKGAIIFVEFNNTGEIESFCRLSSESFNIGVDIEPGIFHTFFAVVADTVLFEVKPGPYEQISDKDFASWAPMEGSESAFEYLRNLYELTTK